MARATEDDVNTEPTRTRRQTSSRASAMQSAPPNVHAKGAAIVAIGALCVALVGLAVAKLGPPPPRVHDATNDKDYPGMVSEAKGHCEEAARRAREARTLKDRGDRAAALAKLEQAMALLDRASARYEEVSSAHPGGEYDYMGADIDRMTLERATYRRMMMELRGY